MKILIAIAEEDGTVLERFFVLVKDEKTTVPVERLAGAVRDHIERRFEVAE